jgi:hypothetical protein
VSAVRVLNSVTDVRDEGVWNLGPGGSKLADDVTVRSDPALNVGALAGPLLERVTLRGTRRPVDQASDRALLVVFRSGDET